MTTIWLDIPGYEGRYQAERSGQIRSLVGRSPRVLKPMVQSNGRYLFVRPRLGGKHKNERVAVLVARTFLGPRPEGQEVRHLNDDWRNNDVSNLVYGTRSDNVRDMVKNGNHRNASKTRCLRGHNFTRTSVKGQRICDTCLNQKAREKRARLKTEQES